MTIHDLESLATRLAQCNHEAGRGADDMERPAKRPEAVAHRAAWRDG